MKRIIIIISLFFLFRISPVFSQCSGGLLYATFDVSGVCSFENPITIDNKILTGYYILYTNLTIGSSITFTATSGCMTVHETDQNGDVITYGSGSVTFTATTSTIAVVYSDGCGSCTATSPAEITTTMKMTIPVSEQNCEGASLICSAATINGNSSGAGCDEMEAPYEELDYEGSLCEKTANWPAVNTPAWNTDYNVALAACEATNGSGNCIFIGTDLGTNCTGSRYKILYRFYIIDNMINSGCQVSGEVQSSWYYMHVDPSSPANASLTMDIVPSNETDDYDFSIWGPFTDATAAANCPPTTPPIRCSYAGGSFLTGSGSTLHNTGLNATATDTEEGAYGDGYLEELTTNPGDVYILMVNNFSATTSPYTINWGGSTTLGCQQVILPVELTQFSGNYENRRNHLTWTTASETSNEYFELERSVDGINWDKIGKVAGAGNSSSTRTYDFFDDDFQMKINYYRLSQIDFNNKRTTFDPISIDNSKVTQNSLLLIPNPVKNSVTLNFSVPVSAEYQIKILDVMGNVLYLSTDNLSEGNQAITINTSDFSNGIYHVEITSPKIFLTAKLLKQ